MTIDIYQQVRLIDEKIEKLNKEKQDRILTWCNFKAKDRADFIELYNKENEKTWGRQAEKVVEEFVKIVDELNNITIGTLSGMHKAKPVTATKIFTFDAAHYLEGHPGACRRMHGHTYKLEITFQKNPKMPVSDMNPPDMVMDFSEIKKVINEIIINKFDHQLINEVPEWMKTNLRPTAENMVEAFAKWIMKTSCAGNLVSIRLWETPTSFATWTK